MSARTAVFRYAELEWDRPRETAAPGTAPPAELVAEAERTGARRKKVVRGERGFFMNRSVLPAGFAIPTHAHDHDELMVVLAGGCEVDDGERVERLVADDTIVIAGGTEYAITCGPEGMEFVTIRMGEATMEVAG